MVDYVPFTERAQVTPLAHSGFQVLGICKAERTAHYPRTPQAQIRRLADTHPKNVEHVCQDP